VKTNSRKILLWNPISNHGHLNLYLELYATALLELGYDVTYLADLEESFEARLRNKLPRLSPLKFSFPSQTLKRWSLNWFLSVFKNMFRLSFFYNKIRKGMNSFKKNSSHVQFNVLTDVLEAKSKAGFKPDLVICMYLDMTHLNFDSKKVFRKLHIPWVGLLFHPPTLSNSVCFKRDFWFSDYSNRGAIFFTPNKIESYTAVSRLNQSFEVFPDVTRVPKESILYPSFDFRNFAKGRLVVGLIGSLDGTKKLIQEFLAISDDSRLDNYCFVMVGEVYESTMSMEVLDKVRNRKGVSENLYIDDRYINSEEDFDYLFSQVDIIFACYKNFDSSANVLAKSAHFRKPVLVTAETFIGDLTQQFNLGIAIKNPEADSIAEAILLLGTMLEKLDFSFGFDEYISRVSPENLKNRLDYYLKNLWEL
jgi:hypothetical protein